MRVWACTKHTCNARFNKKYNANSADIVAYAVLPNEEGRQGLRDTVQELFQTDSSWDAKVHEDEMSIRLVQLQLPRFEVSYGIKSLNKTFVEMGMGDVFDASTANFDRMAPGKGICISEILHKAVMKVDEAGTVAAAVTAVCTTKSCCAPRAPVPKKVTIDRPFLFVVYDRLNKMTLFVAKVETVPAADAGDEAAGAASTDSAAVGEKRKMEHERDL